MAAEGLLNNTALTRVPLNTADYLAQVMVADFATTLAGYVSAETAGDISQATVDAFASSMDLTTPYISNATISPDISTNEYTTILEQHAENLFPTILNAPAVPQSYLDTNNQLFVQYALIAMGQKESANKYINSALNATDDLCAGIYINQDALMTGNISSVNYNVQGWGEELINTGVLFDFATLDNLGTPQAIIESLIRANMLGLISDELTTQGIDVVRLVKAINDNPTRVLSPIVQKRCYDAFSLVTGNKLRNILKAMDFVTGGLSTLQDLLDLTKVFPQTFATLSAPDNGVLKNIYLANSTPQPWVLNLTSPIIAVIPEAQAKTNWAFVISLGQIQGILNSTPQQIGSAASTMEASSGLPFTGQLTEPLPLSTATFILDSMGEGSGPDGTYYLSDLVGAPGGLPFNDNMNTIVANMDAVYADGGFNDIEEILLIMRDVLGGNNTPRVDFDDNSGSGPFFITIQPGFPAAGIYSDGSNYNYTAALLALIAEQDIAVAAYIAAYPNEHAVTLDAFVTSLAGVVGGIQQLWEAEVKFTLTYLTEFETGDPTLNGIPANKKTTLAFTENLGQYGKQTDKGNIASILEAMVTNTQGGNAIIAAMREGRNQAQLDAAGVSSANQISDQPSVVEPGNIS